MALKAWLLKRTVMYNFFDYDEGTKHIVIKNMCVYLLWNLCVGGRNTKNHNLPDLNLLSRTTQG